MATSRVVTWIVPAIIVAAVILAAFTFREAWLGPMLSGDANGQHAGPDHAGPDHAASNHAADASGHAEDDHEHDHEHAGESSILELSAQARKNLGLQSLPIEPQDYWRTILIPGEIDDRPGVSDRGVTSPAVGVVTEIHALPGDTLQPGDALFTLQLFSEYLQSAQSELFKAAREIELLEEQIARLESATSSGAVPKSREIEVNNQLQRQRTLIQAYRQDLLTRGLAPTQIEQVAGGKFVSTIEVVAPPGLAVTSTPAPQPSSDTQADTPSSDLTASADGITYELQELSVDLGQQVQAGQLLAKLANHQSLYVVGHAFKREAAYLEQAAQERRPIEVEFTDDMQTEWPPLSQTLEIRHLSNSIDLASRTFDFFIPLQNQSATYVNAGETYLVWRFRPGQRVRIHVPVEKFNNVFVLPAAAVAQDGPEAYVFRQNGKLFKRLPVHLLYEDRRVVIVANDGSLPAGAYLAQTAAASLNRVLKAQSASGQQPGMHVHADGTVHVAH